MLYYLCLRSISNLYSTYSTLQCTYCTFVPCIVLIVPKYPALYYLLCIILIVDRYPSVSTDPSAVTWPSAGQRPRHGRSAPSGHPWPPGSTGGRVHDDVDSARAGLPRLDRRATSQQPPAQSEAACVSRVSRARIAQGMTYLCDLFIWPTFCHFPDEEKHLFLIVIHRYYVTSAMCLPKSI